LLGCDYLEPIKGIGPKSAFKLIREHGSLGAIITHLREKEAERDAAAKVAEESEEESDKNDEDKSDAEGSGGSGGSGDEEVEKKPKKKKSKPKKKAGISIPEDWPWEEAQKLFLNPDVTPADQVELNWEPPDVDGLVDFLVKDKGFNEDRVRKGAEKLAKFLQAKQQGRLDGFFKVTPKSPDGKASAKGKGSAAKGKGASGGTTKGSKRKNDDKTAAGSSKKARK